MASASQQYSTDFGAQSPARGSSPAPSVSGTSSKPEPELLSARDRWGRTPLDEAHRAGAHAAVALLLSYQSQPHYHYPQTPLGPQH